MKKVTSHRIISFLLTERIVKSYGRLVNKEFRLADTPSGQTGWCDFLGAEDWGECVLVMQDEDRKTIIKDLFYISDLEKVKQEYGVQVDPDSISLSQTISRGVHLIDTKGKINGEIEKKLKKKYPYQQNSYSRKGTLIVGVLDPTFGGFKNDIEVSKAFLDDLAVGIEPLFQQSSFCSILLIDAMSLFEKDSENLTYKLK